VESEDTRLNHLQEESPVTICAWYPLLLIPGTALLPGYGDSHYGTEV